MDKKTVPAGIEYLEEVLAFVDSFLEPWNCSKDQKYRIDVSVEELFTNIVSYAYKDGAGDVEVLCETEASGSGPGAVLTIRLRDQGVPYNPWLREDPDFHVPFDQRPIGGLGVYMTRRFMDHVDYQYENGCNVTTLKKFIGGTCDGGNL